MKKYILSVNPINSNKNHAGSKAVLDINRYLDSENFETITIGDITEHKYKNLIRIIIKSWNYARKVKLNSIVVVQYPIISPKIDNVIQKLYLSKLKKKGCTIIAVIHDIQSLRFFSKEICFDEKSKDEIDLFNKFDYIVSHNKKMTKWLMNNGLNSKVVDLELFDYYIDLNNSNDDKVEEILDNKIAFAGNLHRNKSGFIYALSDIEKLKLNLYGPNYENLSENTSTNINYLGICSPEELPFKIKGKYGIIWDGDSLLACTGNIGEYMKYNNPHKLSMYIASKLPVIVWKEAAIYDFVKKYNIGIGINSINEIEEIINNIDEKDYLEMKNNICKLRSNVIQGYFIKSAMKKIESQLT